MLCNRRGSRLTRTAWHRRGRKMGPMATASTLVAISGERRQRLKAPAAPGSPARGEGQDQSIRRGSEAALTEEGCRWRRWLQIHRGRQLSGSWQRTGGRGAKGEVFRWGGGFTQRRETAKRGLRWRSALFKGDGSVEQQRGWSRAAPCSKEVGDGLGPIGRRRAADNCPAMALTGDARSAPKQGPGTLTRGPVRHSNGRRRGMIQKSNSNEIQILSKFDRSRKDLPELKKN
jgi:hypothetical protein